MVKYPLKKLNNDNNKDLVVAGLNSLVLLDCSPAERIQTCSTLTFGNRATPNASSTLTPVTCFLDKNSSVRNNHLADRPEKHETQQHNFPNEKIVPLRKWNLLQHHKQVVGINPDRMASQLVLLVIAQNKGVWQDFLWRVDA